MANIILSCGHSIDHLEQGHDLMIKGVAETGEKAINYGIYCTVCAIKFRNSNLILNTWTDAEDWLSTPDW